MKPMQNYLAEVWKCRYFWLSLIKNDLRTRYRGSVLGIGWSLVHPLAMTAVLCTVFHKLWGMPIREYGPFVLSGLTFWSFLHACTLQGCHAFFAGETYIRQYPAPLMIYPLRTVLGAAFHFLLALGVVILATWCFQGFGNVGALVGLLPGLLLVMVLGWSLAVLSAFANVFFPDIQHLLEVGLQILFYATPIFYQPEMMHERGLGWLVDFNPLAALVECLRLPILAGEMPHASALGVATLVATLFVGLAVLTLSRLQQKMIFYL